MTNDTYTPTDKSRQHPDWPPSGRTHAAFATVKDTAAYLRVSEKTVRRLIRRGFFKPSKAIRKILIPRSQLEAFYEMTN